MNDKVYIGIDIGLKGAVAFLYPDGSNETFPMPVIKNQVDFYELNRLILSKLPSRECMITFEKLGVIFGSSKATAFSMGMQSGAVEMLAISNQLPYIMVPAKQWQKDMFIGINEIKDSKGKRDTKSMALVAIKRLIPTLKLTFGDRATKPHDGLIDAMLMALWAQRNKL